jgi:hypothetical protein
MKPISTQLIWIPALAGVFSHLNLSYAINQIFDNYYTGLCAKSKCRFHDVNDNFNIDVVVAVVNDVVRFVCKIKKWVP